MMLSSSKWLVAAALAAGAVAGVAQAQTIPTIRVGWTIPAEESKYWMMKRPEEFPNLGKAYNIEWTQFKGTSPMTAAHAGRRAGLRDARRAVARQRYGGGNLKALYRGAACRREARQLLGLLGGEG